MKRDMRRLGRDKRGVEPVIAALLLIAIAVAAAVVTYSWVMGMISSQGSQAQTSIRIDVVQFVDANTTMVTIRNSGTVGVSIDNIYITNPSGSTQTLTFDEDRAPSIFNATSQTLASKASRKFECTLTDDTFTFVAGSPYTIKVVTDNGFAVEGSYYAPSGLT